MPKKKFTNGDKIFLNQAFEKMLRSQGFREGLYPDLFSQIIDGNAVTENLVFYVDAVNGDDSNDGLTASSAYRTIQACLDDNVTGKFLYGNVTINCAAGNYGGIRLDHAMQVAGSVIIAGTMQLATLATGLNSTTISSWANAAQSTPDNPFQITCTGAGWTTNDLRDKFVKITRQSTGTISYWTVVENTSDTVKLNSWGLTPSAGDLVEIVAPACNFTNGYVTRVSRTQSTIQILQNSLIQFAVRDFNFSGNHIVLSKTGFASRTSSSFNRCRFLNINADLFGSAGSLSLTTCISSSGGRYLYSVGNIETELSFSGHTHIGGQGASLFIRNDYGRVSINNSTLISTAYLGGIAGTVNRVTDTRFIGSNFQVYQIFDGMAGHSQILLSNVHFRDVTGDAVIISGDGAIHGLNKGAFSPFISLYCQNVTGYGLVISQGAKFRLPATDTGFRGATGDVLLDGVAYTWSQVNSATNKSIMNPNTGTRVYI